MHGKHLCHQVLLSLLHSKQLCSLSGVSVPRIPGVPVHILVLLPPSLECVDRVPCTVGMVVMFLRTVRLACAEEELSASVTIMSRKVTEVKLAIFICFHILPIELIPASSATSPRRAIIQTHAKGSRVAASRG